MTLKLYFPITAKPIQSARFAKIGGFIKSYQPASNHEYKGCIKALTINQLPIDFKPLTGALEFFWWFIFPLPKSATKKTQKLIESGEIIYKTTRPDCENLLKGTTDALQGILFNDDSQICRLFFVKHYGLNPEIRLEVKEL